MAVIEFRKEHSCRNEKSDFLDSNYRFFALRADGLTKLPCSSVGRVINTNRNEKYKTYLPKIIVCKLKIKWNFISKVNIIIAETITNYKTRLKITRLSRKLPEDNRVSV